MYGLGRGNAVRAIALATMLGAGLAALAPAGGAAAQAQPKSAEIYTEFTASLLVDVLGELGYSARIITEEETPFIAAVSPTGRPFIVYFSVCNVAGNAGCLGFELISLIDTSPATVPLSAINSFNTQYGFAKAFRYDDSTAGLSRYAIADDGISRGNIAANISNFVALLDRFAAALSSPLASLEGETDGAADALAASHADERQKRAMEVFRNGTLEGNSVNALPGR